MATDKAQPPEAPTNDFAADIAELRQEVVDLIADRESLQDENADLKARVDKLESTPADIAKLRQEVVDLIADRESLQDENAELKARVDKLEATPASGGGVSAAAIDREIGKLRRALEYVRDQAVPRLPLDPYEALEPPPEPAANPVVDGGNGVTAGGTATNS